MCFRLPSRETQGLRFMLLSYFVDRFFISLLLTPGSSLAFFFLFFFFFFFHSGSDYVTCFLQLSVFFFFYCFASLGLGQCSNIPKWDLNYDFALLFWFLSGL